MTDEPRLPSTYRLVTLDTIDSTNQEAKRLARAGAEDGTLVWARQQTAGRGRGGRAWVSPRGNLYLSLIARPDYPAAEASQLSFVTAVALGAALASIVPSGVEIHYKWPNDVLLAGRKVAGILLEAESNADGALDWLIIGVGVNVTSHPEVAGFPATSLSAEAGQEIEVETVLEAFAEHMLAWVNLWLNEGFAPVREAWLARAKGKDERIAIRLPDRTMRGRFADIDSDGALVLELRRGERRRVTAGDVFFGAR